MRFGGIYVDPIEGRKGRGVEPGTVGEERVSAEISYSRFEMQAASDRNGDDFIIVPGEDGGELSDAFRVAALGKANEYLSVDVQDIAAFESAGERYIFELAKLAERMRERRGLTSTGFSSERQNDRQFIENNHGIFDEHGIRKLGLGWK